MFSLQSKPMQYMSLYLLKDDVPSAAIILAQSQSFDLSKANQEDSLLTEHYDEDYANQFEQALGRYKKVVFFLKIKLKNRVKNISHISYDYLKQSNELLGEIWNQCISFEIQQRKLLEQKRMINHLKSLWKNIAKFDTDLSILDNQLDFLDIRLGLMPSGHVIRLKKSLSLEGYYLLEHVQSGENTHVLVAGLQENQEKIQDLLDAATFQKIQIPAELHGQPDKVNSKISDLESQYHAELMHLKLSIEIFQSRNINQILQVGDTLTLARPYRLLSEQMHGIGALVNVNGWILQSQVESIKNQLHNALGKKAVILTRAPHPDEYEITPSVVNQSTIIKPFIKLIKHYGIPRYNELDPSWFFTLSYILMFGMMFGDIGHGLCFMGLAVLLLRKLPEFSMFLLFIGLSSVLFGFLYGSFFCYEHVFDAIWMTPLSDPILMLEMAFWWGVGFIVLLNLFSIYNRFSAKKIRQAMMDGQGLSGLFLYLSMIWLGYQFISDDYKSSYWLLVMIPLIMIGVNKWFDSDETHGERLLIIIIESYELMINYLANTISFLRLAAFSLNHVALAITVFTLADMLEGHAHWLVIVFGNLFILLLEGAVVAIQTLRLEYYEGFSRFFYADGFLFEPLNLSPKKLL
ncbi:MAG: hypothetical protein OQL19_20810 [Gammaproteobacteria bacterium]|nr:hypothetical protein [Gammaproteobacteria bacterium]